MANGFRETLLCVGLTLQRCGNTHVSLPRFVCVWLELAPPTLPLWGVGNAQKELFMSFLAWHQYLDLRYDEDGRVTLGPTERLRDYFEKQSAEL